MMTTEGGSMSLTPDQPCANTDREIYREREDDYYADSIHVTEDGRIGIDCGGRVFVKPLRRWHELAKAAEPAQPVMAWAHKERGDTDVITNRVKAIWEKVDPKHVEHYTVALYTSPQMPPMSGEGIMRIAQEVWTEQGWDGKPESSEGNLLIAGIRRAVRGER